MEIRGYQLLELEDIAALFAIDPAGGRFISETVRRVVRLACSIGPIFTIAGYIPQRNACCERWIGSQVVFDYDEASM
jgi:hypothetical protein